MTVIVFVKPLTLTVMVAVRKAVPLLVVTFTSMALLPVPEDVLSLHQSALLVAVHSALDITLNVACPFSGAKAISDCDRLREGASCFESL